MENDQGYNGWENRETWNVALWIGNDEGLYHLALECADYPEFQRVMREDFEPLETPDQVSWSDSALNIDELSDMIRELRS